MCKMRNIGTCFHLKYKDNVVVIISHVFSTLGEVDKGVTSAIMSRKKLQTGQSHRWETVGSTHFYLKPIIRHVCRWTRKRLHQLTSKTNSCAASRPRLHCAERHQLCLCGLRLVFKGDRTRTLHDVLIRTHSCWTSFRKEHKN